MEIKKNGETIAELILPVNSACVHVDANGDTKIELFSVGSDTFEISLTDAEVMQLRMALHQRDRKRELEYTPDWSTLEYDHVRQDADGHVFNFKRKPEYEEKNGEWSGRRNISKHIGKFRPPVNAQLASWDRPGK